MVELITATIASRPSMVLSPWCSCASTAKQRAEAVPVLAVDGAAVPGLEHLDLTHRGELVDRGHRCGSCRLLRDVYRRIVDGDVGLTHIALVVSDIDDDRRLLRDVRGHAGCTRSDRRPRPGRLDQ